MIPSTNKAIIIDNEFIQLFFHNDTGIVHHVFGANMRSEDLRQVLNTGNDLLRSNGAFKWLSDNRATAAHSEEDTEWINTVWLPAAIEAGWKYWALVVPDDFKAKINMTEFVDTFYEMGVRIMVFTDDATAMEWLINIDK